MNNKKGISAVIATVLIILITIAAVAIMWSPVSNMIKGMMESGAACINVQTEIELGDRTCVNYSSVNELKVQVVRKSKDFDLEYIQIGIVDGEGTSTSHYLITSSSTVNVLPSGATYQQESSLPLRNEARTFTLDLDGLSLDADDLTRVSVSPVIRVDGKLENCGETASVALVPCP